MRRVAAVLVLVGVAGCGGSSGPPPKLHRADGVRYLLPAGWHAARHSLTPHLLNPREVFTVGTGRLAASGGRCAQMPSAALAAMRPTDVLVSLQERFGSPFEFPPRPRHFHLAGPSLNDAALCGGPHRAFSASFFGFRGGG